MKLIVGLGNPGEKYAKTRHNAGFAALDHYVQHNDEADGQFKPEKRFQAEITEIPGQTGKVLLAKPQTYMNNSGEAVRAISSYYDISPLDTLVVYDELALPFGTVRTRQAGESAGHNGVKSIISQVGPGFLRLRIGIQNELTDTITADTFVLANFTSDEAERLPRIFDVCNQLIDEFIRSNNLEAKTVKI